MGLASGIGQPASLEASLKNQELSRLRLLMKEHDAASLEARLTNTNRLADIGCWLQAGGRPVAAVRGGVGGCPAPAAGTQWRLPAGAAHSFGATIRPLVAGPGPLVSGRRRPSSEKPSSNGSVQLAKTTQSWRRKYSWSAIAPLQTSNHPQTIPKTLLVLLPITRFG